MEKWFQPTHSPRSKQNRGCALNRFQQLKPVKISGVAIHPLSATLDYLEGEARKILPQGYKVDYRGKSRQLRVGATNFCPRRSRS
jgi:multidrug efflux pump